MKKEQISDALNMLNDDIIEETNTVRTTATPKHKWGRLVATVACACLIITGVFAWRHFPNQSGNTPGITVSDKGVTIPKMEVTLSSEEEAQACMIAFFIYHGNCYVQYDWLPDGTDIIGEQLGTATGLIDEWTPRDGYVEFAGSVKGDFFAVKGYDPSFMLCLQYSDGTSALFICNTGITLKYGSELYTDRIHLSENYASVQYESRDSWNNSKNERYQLEEADGVIRAFIAGLNAAEFISRESIPLDEGKSDVFEEMEIYHLYFNMQDGITVHLRLFKDGYVLYQGILSVCVQVDGDCYNNLIDALESQSN